MSRAQQTFEGSIQDAENLLGYFDQLNPNPPPPELEVLKRAGLILAMTAWETYVEDLLQEQVIERLRGIADSTIAGYVETKLSQELKMLNNPDSQKTIRLFREFAGVDLNQSWCFNNFDNETVKAKLNQYLKLRGDVVHRSRPVCGGPTQAHPVKREDLVKVIGFLGELVKATERAF